MNVPKCPMLKGQDCIRSNCAWWVGQRDSDNGCCVILFLGQAAKEIGLVLGVGHEQSKH
jgi:hypothetical protein